MAKELEKPMSLEEVKEFLGMKKTWLYEQLQSGRLPGHKLGRRWIIYPSELKRYLDQQPSNIKKLKLSK